VKNADNSQSGVGALWDYSSSVGSDNILSAAELSLARTLKFNNPNSEAFTVTFNVIGNLANTSSGSSSSGSSSSGGGGSGGSSTTSSVTSTTTAVTTMVFQATYNPLLNTVTIKVLTL